MSDDLVGRLRLPTDRIALVVGNLELARRAAARTYRRLPMYLDFNDLLSEAKIGLVESATRWEPEKGCPFRTFAWYRMNGQIRDYLRSLDYVPRTLRLQLKQIDYARKQVEQRLGGRCTLEDLADALGWTLDEVHRVVAYSAALYEYQVESGTTQRR